MKDFYSNYVIPANIQFARIDPEYKNRIYHYFCGSPIHSQRRYIKALVYNEVVALYLSGNIDEASKIACRLESFHTFYWEDHELERIEKGRLLECRKKNIYKFYGGKCYPQQLLLEVKAYNMQDAIKVAQYNGINVPISNIKEEAL